MSLATGAKSALRVKEEIVYGVPPVGNWESISFNSETLQGTINSVISNEVKSDRTVGSVRGGNISAGGEVTVDMYIQKLGLWWKHLLCTTDVATVVTPSALATGAITRGTYVTSGANTYVALADGTVSSIAGGLTVTNKQKQKIGGVEFQHVALTATPLYSHVMQAAINPPTGGLSIEKYIGGGTADAYFPFYGGRISSAAVTIPQEGMVSVAFSLLSASAEVAAGTSIAGTPTSTGDEPAVGFDSFITFNSVAQGTIQSASLSINNNFDGNAFVLGSRNRVDVPVGRREVTGTATLFFADITNYNLFRNETSVPMKINFISNGYWMEWDMPEVKFTGGSPSPQIAGNGTITQTFNFQAFKQSGAYDLKLTLKNGIVSAY